jgi:NADH:ubiquinone reductase (H+-translocating)
MHRGYHVLTIPTWERKLRVLGVWISAVFGGRDIVSLSSVQSPRAAFVSAGEPLAVDRHFVRPTVELPARLAS